MNAKSLAHATLLLVAIATGPAHALPIVVGSTYDTALQDAVVGLVINTVTFDGAAETFGNVTINESQTVLGGTLFQVGVDFTSSTDIFLGIGNELFNIGGFSNGMDLTGAFAYVSGYFSIYDLAGALIGTFSISAANTNPWDGFDYDAAVGWTVPTGGAEVGRLSWRVTLQQVPEPGTLALVGSGLIGLAWRRRRT